ncbi:hypothetical protein ILUMI_27503 [Ignelater luminosus]|uniref:Uncharacterized protein n=1 Tax=Ignelater luminosus TaxID=2038154 RepID=A0A8K0C502_IGNLU|nr:hypothetical protein ILUMI_27503 [Ignelater luminosus]
MSIYDIPDMVKIALSLAATSENIKICFKVAGVCLFNRDIFSDADFMLSYVTDRPARVQQLLKDTLESPLPRVGERKSGGGRKKRKAVILTDSPVKHEIELERAKKKLKEK